MKWTTVLVLLVVVAMVAEARLTPEERAQKRADKQAAKAARRAKKHNKGCAYHFRQATCDEASGQMVAPLNAEKSTDTNCEATKTMRRNCNSQMGGNRRDCKYSHEGMTCDPTTLIMTKQIMADQPADCPATKTKTVKKCPDMDKLREKIARRGEKKGCGCKYHRRGTCDPETLTVTRALKRCAPSTCTPAVMTETVTECPTGRQAGGRRGGRRGNRGKNRL